MREKLANLEHKRWSGWMKYLFSKCTFNADGTATIPVWAVENWQRQMNTPYSELSEKEKEGDRAEVDKTLVLLSGEGTS